MENKQSELAEKEAEISALFKRVFCTPEGEQVLKILAIENHILDGTYSDEPHKMYFREGQRLVVKDILRRIEVDELLALKRIRKMIDEQINPEDT